MGANLGFYGCPNYPRCREVVPVAAGGASPDGSASRRS